MGPSIIGGGSDRALAALVGKPGKKRVIIGGPYAPPTEFFQFLIGGQYIMMMPGATITDTAAALSTVPGVVVTVVDNRFQIAAKGFDDIEIDDGALLPGGEGAAERLGGIGLVAGIYPPTEMPTGIFAENLALRKDIADVGSISGTAPLVESGIIHDWPATYDFTAGSFTLGLRYNGLDHDLVVDAPALINIGWNPASTSADALIYAMQVQINAITDYSGKIYAFPRTFGMMGRIALSGTETGWDENIAIMSVATTGDIPAFGFEVDMYAVGTGRSDIGARIYSLQQKDQVIVDRLDAAGIPQLG